MQSFLPDNVSPKPSAEQERLTKIEQALQKQAQLYENIRKFIRDTRPSDFAMLSSQGQKTQYTHLHDSIKKKGGSPPREFSAIEDFVDLQRHMDLGEYDLAIPLYFKLKRLVSG